MVFAGGCITAQLHPASNTTTFAGQASTVLSFTTRRSLQQTLDARTNGQLHLDPAETP
jgi:regulator of RNase E activity RraA